MTEPVLGIDFGTSCCRVAVADSRGDRASARLVSVDKRAAVFPSLVCVDFLGGGLAGDEAERLAALDPGSVIWGAKALLGSDAGEKPSADGEACDSAVFARSDWGGPRCERRPDGSIGLRVRTTEEGPREITPGTGEAPPGTVEPLQAVTELFRLAREMARRDLGLPIVRCVIAVPPAFGPGRREIIAAAASAAGLDVLGLIGEGVASVLAHCGTGRQRAGSAGECFVTIDAGGGFTGLTVVARDGARYRELAATGTRLGGEGIEDHLARYLLEEFSRQPDWPSESPSLLGRLRRTASEAMPYLAKEESFPVVILAAGRTYAYLLTRSQVNKIGEPIARYVRENVPKLWHRWGPAGGGKDGVVGPVLLPVGGLTRAPFLQQVLKSVLDRDRARVVKPLPLESVALGAALWGQAMVQPDASAKEATGGIQLASVAPWTIAVGREASDPRVLIPAGSSLPCQATCGGIGLGEGGDGRAALRLLEAPLGDQPVFREIGQVCLESGGQRRIAGLKVRLVVSLTSSGRLQVKAQDEATNEPVAARVRFSGLALEGDGASAKEQQSSVAETA